MLPQTTLFQLWIDYSLRPSREIMIERFQSSHRSSGAILSFIGIPRDLWSTYTLFTTPCVHACVDTEAQTCYCPSQLSSSQWLPLLLNLNPPNNQQLHTPDLLPPCGSCSVNTWVHRAAYLDTIDPPSLLSRLSFDPYPDRVQCYHLITPSCQL